MPPGDLESLVKVHDAVATNISGGGMQVRARGPAIELGDLVEARLPFLPPPLDREACYAKAVQVYQPPPHGLFGLEFEKISVRLQAGILKEVERRQRAIQEQFTAGKQVASVESLKQ